MEKALYYVTVRGEPNQDIVKDEEDHQMFIELLNKYKGNYKFRLFAYTILRDHFHLLLELPEQKEDADGAGLLSNIMRDLNSSYTKYYNGKYSRKGHLFRERYRAALIEKEPYLLRLSAYIHLNPSRLNPASGAGDYPFSSYAFYLNREVPAAGLMKDEIEEVLGLLAGQGYAEFVGRIAGEPELLDLHDYLQKGILGSKDFQEKVKRLFSVYRKEKPSEGPGPAKKLAVTSLVVLILAAGVTIALKLGLEEKNRRDSSPLAESYKLPTQVKELLRDLENTEWQIRMVAKHGGKVQNDTVRFEDGKFISRNYSQKDYPPSDYSLIIEDDNRIVWETAQAGPDGVILSWRGEIKKGEIEGGLRLGYPDGKTQDFSFVSVSSRRRE